MTVPSKRMELKDFFRVCSRGALLSLPFLVLLLLEVLVLPIDFFTFRVWEAALATPPYRYPSPFYPNLHIKKNKEFGDRYRAGDPSMVQAKPVEWFTDAYGWRNRRQVETQERYDVVVLGDSNIVGSFLDQKDTLSEVLSARANKAVYSYAGPSAGLYFSDPRMAKKSGDLLVIESKVGNWNENNSYLADFQETTNGALNVVDKSKYFSNDFNLSRRRYFFKKIASRLTKQAMFHWLKANPVFEFSVPSRAGSNFFRGKKTSELSENRPGWYPDHWIGKSGAVKYLPGFQRPTLAFRGTGPNASCRTECFVCPRKDGEILVRFEAKNSISPSWHVVFLLKGGSFRQIGAFAAGREWQTFEIPISAEMGSILGFEIEQRDSWQWMLIKNLRVIGAEPLPSVEQTPLTIPMIAWTGDGLPCAETGNNVQDCRRWIAHQKNGSILTPVLPEPGESGLLVLFEARTDTSEPSVASVYLSEGGQYRAVAQHSFGSDWRKYMLQLQSDRTMPIKVRIDYPDSAGALSIRNFQAIPLDKSHRVLEMKASAPAAPVPQKIQKTSVEKENVLANFILKPPNLTPLDGSGRSLTVNESRYYFYQAAKIMQRKAQERGMDLILFVMPDPHISRLMPAIRQLRAEGIKVLAYESQESLLWGVDVDWYWQKADSHWTEAAVRLTADEILDMWQNHKVANRPFSEELMRDYANGFPQKLSSERS
jgi:hypothetical protein